MTNSRYELGHICTSCRRRRAVYLRRTSGEKLCSSCYEKSLIKVIKRALRDVNELRPGATIASIIILERLIPSLTLLYCLNRVEQRYGCSVLALAFYMKGYEKVIEDVINSVLISKFNFNKNLVKVLEVEEGLRYTPNEMLDYYLSVTSNKLSMYSNIAVFPFTLNDVSEAAINSLLYGDLKSIALPQSFKVGDTRYVMPFYNIPNYDIYVFSYVKGFYDHVLDDLIPSFNKCLEPPYKHYIVIKELIKDLSYNNPELTQTLVKSVNKLFKAANP
ncbi:MAG: hypothetical protein RMH77_03940 [Sulfolobales archaeon]|nr:hypothetical protein [Sulfolobales archaeon]MDW7969541.1 hypothetical protein [Sulfolobales archaeon]